MVKYKSYLVKKHRSGPADGDISWGQWRKRRMEEYENKKSSPDEQPQVLEQSEAVEKMAASPKQVKRKRKKFENTEESQKVQHSKSDLVQPESGFDSISGSSASAPIPESMVQDTADQQKKKRKKREKCKKSSKDKQITSDLPSSETGSVDIGESAASAPIADSMEQDSAEIHQKKKRKTKHKEANHEELEETQTSSDSKGDKQTSDVNEEKYSALQKIKMPVLPTFKTHELKSFLAAQGMTLKQWKQKRKEEYRMWKEAKEAKKLKQLKESTADKNSKEDEKETVGNGKNYTVSIALPGSILDNAQSPELKTYLAGQIARAAAVFNVNEIVIFEENGNPSPLSMDQDAPIKLRQKHGSTQLIKILQFLECPQYLRRYFFPIQNDLKFAGVLNPLDMPHHLRVTDASLYREGVTLNKPVRDGKGSFVYIGFPRSAVIDKAIEPNVRVTVKLDEQSHSKKHYTGVAVSPSTPYKHDGMYWGYSVRLAESLGAVFSKCPYKEGYDLTIGTSDKGSDVDHCVLPPFKHLLIVFGGLKGLEASLEADEKLTVDDPRFLFHHYLNTCPSQGARTIRTEEAILITLSILRPKILQCQLST